MITVLQYLVIAAAIGLAVFFLAVLVFGRGEQMSPLPARTSPAELPGGAVSGDHIRAVRFAVGARGYRMGDVDWTLDRMADEIDRLRAEVRSLGGDPDRVPAGDQGELLAVAAGPGGAPDRSDAPAAGEASGFVAGGELGPVGNGSEPVDRHSERFDSGSGQAGSDPDGAATEPRS